MRKGHKLCTSERTTQLQVLLTTKLLPNTLVLPGTGQGDINMHFITHAIVIVTLLACMHTRTYMYLLPNTHGIIATTSGGGIQMSCRHESNSIPHASEEPSCTYVQDREDQKIHSTTHPKYTCHGLVHGTIKCMDSAHVHKHANICSVHTTQMHPPGHCMSCS